MGLFDKLFKKKENPKNEVQSVQESAFVPEDDSIGYKQIRQLTDEQKEKIDKSTLQLMATQLYMHYWTDNLVCENPNDQEWQNKVMFFWKAEEPFPKKSLPPQFESFKEKYFIFEGDTSGISLEVGQAIPWFGMPGLGEKHVCRFNSQKITIPELNKLGMVKYIEKVELMENNLNILINRDEYFFLIDDHITPFRNGNFYLNNKPIPIYVAYSIGGIYIVKYVDLE